MDAPHPPSPRIPPNGAGRAAAPVRALPYESKEDRGGRFWRGLVPACRSAVRRNRRSAWVPRGAALLITLGVFAAIAVLRANGWTEFLELKTYDVLVTLQPKDTSVSREIVVVGMTEEDIRSLGYPIPDAALANLLNRILSGNPRAVGVDIFRDNHAGAPQPELAALFDDRRVVWVSKYGDGGVFFGAPPAAKPAQVGFADFPTDRDGRVRRAMPFAKDMGGTTGHAMAMRVATRYLRGENAGLKLGPVPGAPDTWFRLGRMDYRPLGNDEGAYADAEVGESTQILLDFRGAPRFDVLPISVAMTQDPASTFGDKVVLVGMAARDTVKDLISTGLVENQYGTEVHAVLTDQLIRAGLTGRGPPTSWPHPGEYLWVLGWTLLGGLLGLAVRKPWRFATVLGISVLALAGVVYAAFVAGGLWLPGLPALLGCVGAAGFVTQYVSHHERSERTVLNELFKRMVSDDVAATLWQRRDELFDEGRLAAREVQATVLFTDLEGFTAISEVMDKSCLMAWLNRYMTEMSGIVEHSGGFVNKYVGDAVMAVFGPPLERTVAESRQDAVSAVECALAMRESIARHQDAWARECREGVRKKRRESDHMGDRDPEPAELHLRMRVGVYTGPVVAGSLGSAQRLEYTVIGDTVNTAARLESYDKSLMDPDIAAGGCRILIGQSTLECLDGKYATREVGSMVLKGKRATVTLHGVCGRAVGRDVVTTQPAALATPAASVQ